MTPAAAIAALDAALEVAGRPVTLRRVTGTARIPHDVELLAAVSGYAAVPLAGAAQQGDSMVILSPSQIARRQWDWPARKGDQLVIAGRVRTVESVEGKYLGDALVRIEMKVRG